MTNKKQIYPDFVRSSQAAQMLGIAQVRVYQLVHSHQIESVRIGKLIRIYRDSVESYLEAASVAENV